jgi:hypothetical protein
MALVLSHDERRELEARLRSRKIRSEDARRARVILMIADEASYSMMHRDERIRPLRRSKYTQALALDATSALPTSVSLERASWNNIPCMYGI